MKNLLLIAFATLALCFGANVANACPDCEAKAKQVVEEKKADKVDVKDADADKTADAKAATDAKTGKAASNCGSTKRASAGQLVKADTSAKTAKGNCGGCGSGCGDCGSGCGGCDTAKADTKTKDCGGCDKAKTVKN